MDLHRHSFQVSSFDASRSSFEANLHTDIPHENEDEDRSQYAACCTGDFAMQNVILQMNMQLVSYDNRRITRMRIYTRRCKDCFR